MSKLNDNHSCSTPPQPTSDMNSSDSLSSSPTVSPEQAQRFSNSVLVSRIPPSKSDNSNCPTSNCYNLTSRDNLAELFENSNCGRVYNCHYVPGSERTVAVVEFGDRKSIERAVMTFNDVDYNGFKLSVQSIAELRAQLHSDKTLTDNTDSSEIQTDVNENLQQSSSETNSTNTNCHDVVRSQISRSGSTEIESQTSSDSSLSSSDHNMVSAVN